MTKKNFLRTVMLFLLSATVQAGCYYNLESFNEGCTNSGGTTTFLMCKPFPEYDYRLNVGCFRPEYSLGLNIQLTCAGWGNPVSPYCPTTPANQVKPINFTNSAKACGSVVLADSQTLIEKIPLAGIPFDLVYSSLKVKGRKDWNKITIPVTSSNFNSGDITGENLVVNIAGKTESFNYGPTAGISHSYTWDGLDSNGDPVAGTVAATAEVVSEFNFPLAVMPPVTIYSPPLPTAYIMKPAEGTPNLDSAKTLMKYYAPIKSEFYLGRHFDDSFGVGGWSFSVHHVYDKTRKILYFGDGTSFNVGSKPQSNGDLLVVSRDREEVYIFDSQGKHLYTKDILLGVNKYSFTYNGSRLLAVTDQFNNSVSIQYSNDVPVSITSAFGVVTELTSDSNGYLAKVINPADEEYEFEYSSDGLLTSFKKPSGFISTMTYDADGRLLSDTNSVGNEIALDFTNPLSITTTSKLSRETKHTITSSAGLIARVETLPNQYFTSVTEYETGDLLIRDSFGNGLQKTTENDARFGSPFKRDSGVYKTDVGIFIPEFFLETVSLSNPNDPYSFNTYSSKWMRYGTFSSFDYSKTSNSVTLTSPLGAMKSYSLGAEGQVLSLQFASFAPYQYTYDNHGRLTTATQAGRSEEYSYNSVGLLESIENSLGQSVNFSYDLNGRMVSKTLPDSRIINFNYDLNGNLASITPPGRSAHSLNYDGNGKLLSYVSPIVSSSSDVTTFTYDDDRDLVSVQRPNGENILFNRNLITGNLDTITFPNGSRSFGYNFGVVNTSLSEDGIISNPVINGTKVTRDIVTSNSHQFTLNLSFDGNHSVSNETITKDLSSWGVNFGYNSDRLVTSAGALSVQRNI